MGVLNMSTSSEMTRRGGLNLTRTEVEGRRVDASIGSCDPQTFWEKVAETRWGKYITAIEHRAIMHANSFFMKPTTALEVGCEGGRWTALLSSLGWDMICTDVDKSSLELCKKRIPDATCILVDPKEQRIPCESESIDMLLCIEVLPVVQADWFFTEALRTLRPGGALVLVVTNGYSLRRLGYQFMMMFTGKRKSSSLNPWLYKVPYGKWKDRLSTIGFEIVHEEGMCWLPFSRESNSLLVPPLTQLERYVGLRRFTKFSPWIAVVARKNSIANVFPTLLDTRI